MQRNGPSLKRDLSQFCPQIESTAPGIVLQYWLFKGSFVLFRKQLSSRHAICHSERCFRRGETCAKKHYRATSTILSWESSCFLIVQGLTADIAPANHMWRVWEKMRSSLSGWMTERASVYITERERGFFFWGGGECNKSRTGTDCRVRGGRDSEVERISEKRRQSWRGRDIKAVRKRKRASDA